MKPHIVACIFARGGSKGVPRKNIRPLGGKPLIAHAVEVARSIPMVDRVVVSTEDEEIRAVAVAYGAEAPFMRPLELAQDDSPEWLAWQHAVRSLNAVSDRPLDVLVSVPAIAPLRAVQDVERTIDALLAGDADLVFTVTPSARSPYFSMVQFDGDCVHLVCPPEGNVWRRQDAPPVYDITPVAYAVRASYVLSAERLLAGKIGAVIVPPERAVDIDSELDFTIAECLYARRAAGAIS